MERDQVAKDLDQAKKAIDRGTTALPNLIKEVDALEIASAKSVKWLKLNPSEASIDAKITANKNEQTELQKRIDKLQEEISGKRKQIIAEARVVACTAYKPLIDKEITELEFDVVVIDEASMIPLSLFYCSAAKAKSRLVIAGDFRQLPPIVQVGTKLKKENFKVSATGIPGIAAGKRSSQLMTLSIRRSVESQSTSPSVFIGVTSATRTWPKSSLPFCDMPTRLAVVVNRTPKPQ
jgi:superfamily I DNA and/or RNA helicase